MGNRNNVYIKFASCVLIRVHGKRLKEQAASPGRDISTFNFGFEG